MPTDPCATAAAHPLPLRWTEGRYGSHFAMVGKITRSVATVTWSTVRADPKPYIVRVSLPGMDAAPRQAETLDEAKAMAAARVNKWLRDAMEVVPDGT